MSAAVVPITVRPLEGADAANFSAVGDAWDKLPYHVQLAVGSIARRRVPGVYASALWHELTKPQAFAVVSALAELSGACDVVAAALETAASV